MPQTITCTEDAQAVVEKWLLQQGFGTVRFSSNSGPCIHEGERAYSVIVTEDYYAQFIVT